MTPTLRPDVHLVRNPEQWALEIRAAHGRTVEAVVEVGLTLLACKQEIGHGGFEEAVLQSGMSEGTARKYMAIAECSAISNRSQGNDLLPGSWTSLYELTQLGDDLSRALDAGEIRPDMTRRDATALVHKYRAAAAPPPPDQGPAPKPRRKPLSDDAFNVAYDLHKVLTRMERVLDDDRIGANADSVFHRFMPEIERAGFIARRVAQLGVGEPQL